MSGVDGSRWERGFSYPRFRSPGRTIISGLGTFRDGNVTVPFWPFTLRYPGFGERVRGSHHLFGKEGFVEIVNLQSRGGHAKPYQVRQVRRLILKYKLGADD